MYCNLILDVFVLDLIILKMIRIIDKKPIRVEIIAEFAMTETKAVLVTKVMIIKNDDT